MELEVLTAICFNATLLFNMEVYITPAGFFLLKIMRDYVEDVL